MRFDVEWSCLVFSGCFHCSRCDERFSTQWGLGVNRHKPQEMLVLMRLPSTSLLMKGADTQKLPHAKIDSETYSESRQM